MPGLTIFVNSFPVVRLLAGLDGITGVETAMAIWWPKGILAGPICRNECQGSHPNWPRFGPAVLTFIAELRLSTTCSLHPAPCIFWYFCTGNSGLGFYQVVVQWFDSFISPMRSSCHGLGGKVMSRTSMVTLWLAGFMVGCTAYGTNIGPDSFSYSASNTALPFQFVDITGTGTKVLANDDDNSVFANIEFGFFFYGTSYTGLNISSNGLLTFGTPWIGAIPKDFATTVAPVDTPMIAVLWDDWSTSKTKFAASDAVYYQTSGTPGSRQFIVEWHNTFPNLPAGSTGLTFEVVLMEGSNNIQMQYLNVVGGTGVPPNGCAVAGCNGDRGSTAGVGIRDTSGQSNGRNLEWSFAPGTAILSNGESILFATPEPSTLSLLVLGALGLILFRCRVRKALPS